MMSSDPNGAGNTAFFPVAASFSAEDKRSHLVQLVLDSVTSPHSKRAYRTGAKRLGVRAGNWLGREQAERRWRYRTGRA